MGGQLSNNPNIMKNLIILLAAITLSTWAYRCTMTKESPRINVSNKKIVIKGSNNEIIIIKQDTLKRDSL